MLKALEKWWQGPSQPSPISIPQTHTPEKVTTYTKEALRQSGDSLRGSRSTSHGERSWEVVDLTQSVAVAAGQADRAQSEERFQEWVKKSETRSASEGRIGVVRYLDFIFETKPEIPMTQFQRQLEKASKDPASALYGQTKISTYANQEAIRGLLSREPKVKAGTMSDAFYLADLTQSSLEAGVKGVNGQALVGAIRLDQVSSETLNQGIRFKDGTSFQAV
ncbi:MAG: hypothetical protein WCG14_01140 [Chlamydiia bacterium]